MKSFPLTLNDNNVLFVSKLWENYGKILHKRPN